VGFFHFNNQTNNKQHMRMKITEKGKEILKSKNYTTIHFDKLDSKRYPLNQLIVAFYIMNLANNISNLDKTVDKISESTNIDRMTIYRTLRKLNEDELCEIDLKQSHGDTIAMSHGDTNLSHGDTSKSHGDTSKSHGETKKSHGDTNLPMKSPDISIVSYIRSNTISSNIEKSGIDDLIENMSIDSETEDVKETIKTEHNIKSSNDSVSKITQFESNDVIMKRRKVIKHAMSKRGIKPHTAHSEDEKKIGFVYSEQPFKNYSFGISKSDYDISVTEMEKTV
jgi:hypothetical protein